MMVTRFELLNICVRVEVPELRVVSGTTVLSGTTIVNIFVQKQKARQKSSCFVGGVIYNFPAVPALLVIAVRFYFEGFSEPRVEMPDPARLAAILKFAIAPVETFDGTNGGAFG